MIVSTSVGWAASDGTATKRTHLANSLLAICRNDLGIDLPKTMRSIILFDEGPRVPTKLSIYLIREGSRAPRLIDGCVPVRSGRRDGWSPR